MVDRQRAAYITHATGKCISAMKVTFRVEELRESEDYKGFGNCVCRLNCKQSRTRNFNPHTDVNRLIVILWPLLQFDYSPYVHAGTWRRPAIVIIVSSARLCINQKNNGWITASPMQTTSMKPYMP